MKAKVVATARAKPRGHDATHGIRGGYQPGRQVNTLCGREAWGTREAEEGIEITCKRCAGILKTEEDK